MKRPIPGCLLAAALAATCGAHAAGGDDTAPQPQETSASGNPILRHEPRETPLTAPRHEGRNLGAIEAHVEKYIGPIGTVYHEVVSDLVHLDVLVIPATPSRPYHVLVTSGASDEPMNTPDGMEDFERIELLVMLPASWRLDEDAFKDEAHYWPVRWLKMLGRLPHEYDTWLGWRHTIPNGDPAEPIADTDFVGMMLSSPDGLPQAFSTLGAPSGDTIFFLALTPLYEEEMDLKLNEGAEALELRFGARRIGPVVDTDRANVAKRSER